MKTIFFVADINNGRMYFFELNNNRTGLDIGKGHSYNEA